MAIDARRTDRVFGIRSFRVGTSLIVLLFALTAASACRPEAPDSVGALRVGFQAPPDSTFPGVYWYFMDGNLSREGMTADLEAMKAAGIAHVLFLEVNVGVPRGSVEFLSEPWKDLFTHAVRECERLGIRLILGSGPGWTGSGGPWVAPEQSMMHLVASATDITGPAALDTLLPVPRPREPFFGEGTLTDELHEIWKSWYEDVVVLAYPTPAAEDRIDRVDEKALYYRAPFTSQPSVLPMLPAPARFDEMPEAAIDPARLIDLSNRLTPDGRLVWDVPKGSWTILRFGTRNNGAVTRPAPVPGLGFEADKFSATALDAHFEAYVGSLLRAAKPRRPASGGGWTLLHFDSWEMGAQNWTPGFREEFLRRRGYDPLPYLPAYLGRIVGSREISERFLWDLRLTAQELVLERHAGHFKSLGRRHGFRFSIEPYDMNPTADLDLGSVADVPMCEFWSDGFGFNSAFSCLEATSIAHVLGRPVVMAEAFTADPGEGFRQYPGRMKNQSDWALAMGVNRFIFHTFAHQPLDDRLRPGMTMGPYGVHWHRHQTFWPMVSAYHRYLSRLGFVLSQGRAVADVLYLTPEGAPMVFQPPLSALEGSSTLPDRRGYAFDGVSPRMLMDHAAVQDGRIVFPGGGRYRLLVLPSMETMTPELLGILEGLIREGATVVGNPPLRSPSLVGYPAADRRVAETAARLWGGLAPPGRVEGRSIGEGALYWGGSFSRPDAAGLYPSYEATSALLDTLGLHPDFVASGALRFAHRSMPGVEVYFVSNRTAERVAERPVFRDGSAEAEWWDPVTGEMKRIGEVTVDEDGARLALILEPFQSGLVVFRTDGSRSTAASGFREAHEVLRIGGPWTVSFDTAMGRPVAVTWDTLVDWSRSGDPGIGTYSGIATYRTTFERPSSIGRNEEAAVSLDLGMVHNLARVRLNGRDLGVVWTAPFRVRINEALRPGSNELEIEVANLWVNRLIGDEGKPDDGIRDGRWPEWLLRGEPRPSERTTFATYRYYDADSPLLPSGLLGPVRLLRAVPKKAE